MVAGKALQADAVEPPRSSLASPVGLGSDGRRGAESTARVFRSEKRANPLPPPEQISGPEGFRRTRGRVGAILSGAWFFYTFC